MIMNKCFFQTHHGNLNLKKIPNTNGIGIMPALQISQCPVPAGTMVESVDNCPLRTADQGKREFRAQIKQQSGVSSLGILPRTFCADSLVNSTQSKDQRRRDPQVSAHRHSLMSQGHPTPDFTGPAVSKTVSNPNLGTDMKVVPKINYILTVSNGKKVIALIVKSTSVRNISQIISVA